MKALAKSDVPPQTIASLPVHATEARARALGAFVVGIAANAPVEGVYVKPVPYVALIMPGLMQAWPTVAACWSPAIPSTGTGAPRRSAVVTPSGDPYNQTILAAPMIGLYILSIFIAWVFGPVSKKPDDKEKDAGEPGD